MTMVPSPLLVGAMSAVREGEAQRSLSGHGRVTLGPARKRVTGVSPISAWSLRWYSCSGEAGLGHDVSILIAAGGAAGR